MFKRYLAVRRESPGERRETFRPSHRRIAYECLRSYTLTRMNTHTYTLILPRNINNYLLD